MDYDKINILGGFNNEKDDKVCFIIITYFDKYLDDKY